MWRLLLALVGPAGALTGAGPKYPKVAAAQPVDANTFGFQSGGAFGAQLPMAQPPMAQPPMAQPPMAQPLMPMPQPSVPQPYAPDAGMWNAYQPGNWAPDSTATFAKSYPGAGFDSFQSQTQDYAYGTQLMPASAPAQQYPAAGYSAGGYGYGNAYQSPPQYAGYYMQAPGSQGPVAASYQGQQQQFPMSPPAPQQPYGAAPVPPQQPAPASMPPLASPASPYPQQVQAPQAPTPPAPAKPEHLKPIKGPLPSANNEPTPTWEPIPVTGPINQIDRDIQNIISSWTGVKTPEAPLAKDPNKAYALGFMG